MTDTTQIPPAAPKSPPFWWPDTRSILAVGTVAGVFGVAGLHNYVGDQVFTAILPLGTLVLGWYFGSSKSSSDKDATITQQLNKGQ